MARQAQLPVNWLRDYVTGGIASLLQRNTARTWATAHNSSMCNAELLYVRSVKVSVLFWRSAFTQSLLNCGSEVLLHPGGYFTNIYAILSHCTFGKMAWSNLTVIAPVLLEVYAGISTLSKMVLAAAGLSVVCRKDGNNERSIPWKLIAWKIVYCRLLEVKKCQRYSFPQPLSPVASNLAYYYHVHMHDSQSPFTSAYA